MNWYDSRSSLNLEVFSFNRDGNPGHTGGGRRVLSPQLNFSIFLRLRLPTLQLIKIADLHFRQFIRIRRIFLFYNPCQANNPS